MEDCLLTATTKEPKAVARASSEDKSIADMPFTEALLELLPFCDGFESFLVDAPPAVASPVPPFSPTAFSKVGNFQSPGGDLHSFDVELQTVHVEPYNSRLQPVSVLHFSTLR
ncbi:hypothetical protein PsorP6_001300 [Peronosclerospora sorghi]|uniref:Uncharacterized protein n=1 Tax=Peronosclerospora sorghi TaxID=230839 RepID=A0ACC0WRI5_9STRA|nr:hypothetical protein PsorP6_001300 [Peronosclerospora sorghi]